MLVEIDEVAINPTDTKEELIQKLDGTVLYLHILSTHPGEELRTIRELAEMGVISTVTIHTKTVM